VAQEGGVEVNNPFFFKIEALEKTYIFQDMIATLAPSQPPLGAGAHMMPRY
jgi:hypothetical protein